MALTEAQIRASIGNVKPHVMGVALDVGKRFDLATIYGIGTRSGPSDHPKGLALDFMVKAGGGLQIGSEAQGKHDRNTGDQVWNTMQHSWKEANVKYVIWQQRIWESPGDFSAGKKMEDRGGDTNNHYDHVHVSFMPTGTYGGLNTSLDSDVPALNGAVDGIGSVVTALTGITKVLDYLTDPRNWVRVAMFAAGIILAIIGLFRMDNVQKAVKSVVSTGKKVTNAG